MTLTKEELDILKDIVADRENNFSWGTDLFGDFLNKTLLN